MYFKLYLLFVYLSINKIFGKQILREHKIFVLTNDINNEINTNTGIQIKRGERANERINLSWPGTKWCGPGNTADNYNDLGQSKEVDKCCRTHDHCDNLAAHETKYNLTNNDFFTRLHCDCDNEFYNCLHTINNNVSNKIGETYFSLRNKCYKDDYPIVDCIDYDNGLFLHRCINYILDESQSKRYQWFDLPLYNGKNYIH